MLYFTCKKWGRARKGLREDCRSPTRRTNGRTL